MDHLIGEITLDKKRRLALGRVLGRKKISSFEVYETKEGYFLKPKVSIPASELWVFENPRVKKSLSKGLSQEPRHSLGSFAKYADKE